jgi:hypothetical protein
MPSNGKRPSSVATALESSIFQRATYHNYKTLVINKCDSHIFCCVKHYPHQLLKGNFYKSKVYG